MDIYDRKLLDEKNKKYRTELSSINDDLAKLILNAPLVESFYINMQERSKAFIESIFWDLSAMQDIRNLFQISPQIEQKLKNYRSFIELHKKIVETWFNKNKHTNVLKFMNRTR